MRVSWSDFHFSGLSDGGSRAASEGDDISALVKSSMSLHSKGDNERVERTRFKSESLPWLSMPRFAIDVLVSPAS